MARSPLAGTSTRAAERTGGFRATAPALGIVAGAVAATADLSVARRAHSREVSASRKKCRVRCVWPRVGRLRGRTLPPPPRSWPGLAPTSPTTHSAPFGALAQAAAPSQHRRSAAAACRDGRRQQPLSGL
jgi:hypothetical protein